MNNHRSMLFVYFKYLKFYLIKFLKIIGECDTRQIKNWGINSCDLCSEICIVYLYTKSKDIHGVTGAISLQRRIMEVKDFFNYG